MNTPNASRDGAPAVACTWAVRLLPSLTDIAFIGPIAFVFLKLSGAKTLLGDGDTGWHIRAGEWMLANGTVPHKDLFSYTRPDAPWFAWEWLWELGAGWLHQQWGLAGVVLASLLVISLTSALLYRLTLRTCGNAVIAIGVTLLAMAASSVHWLARPHLFTTLFTVIFCWMLERVREGKTRLLWLLPPLTVLWTNLHGGFLVGIVLLGGYGAGECLKAAFDRDGSIREGWRRMWPYAATGLACAAASLVNPYFYKLHVHIYNYFADPYHFENIGEFLPISFHCTAARYLEAMLLLASVAVVAAVRRRDFTSALLMLAWAHMALFSARNIPLFAIVAAPAAAKVLSDGLAAGASADIAAWLRRLLGGIRGVFAEFGVIEALPRVHAASAVTVFVICFALLRPLPFRRCRSEYDPKTYPAKAVAFLQSARLESRIYTDDEWGDYLVYSKFRVFVDGRSDFYGSDFGNRFLEVARGSYKWRKTLSRYQVDTVLLQVDNPLAGTLKEARDWRVVYDDGQAIVFRRSVEAIAAPGSENQRDRAIAKLATSDPTITQSYARR